MTAMLSDQGLGQSTFKLIEPHEYAHCIIDVQRKYCDPAHIARRGNGDTRLISGRIATVAPLFRAASVPTYIIYFSYDKTVPVTSAGGGLFMLKMEEGDVALAKNRDSAFEGSDLENILKQEGRRKLLISGFNINACVYSTVLDARRKGFAVDVLRDCVGNDNENQSPPTDFINKMRKRGAGIIDHRAALEAITKAQSAPAPF